VPFNDTRSIGLACCLLMDALSLTLQVGPSPYHRPFLTAVEKNNLDLPFSKVCVTFSSCDGHDDLQLGA
jgi:hypothetical protein